MLRVKDDLRLAGTQGSPSLDTPCPSGSTDRAASVSLCRLTLEVVFSSWPSVTLQEMKPKTLEAKCSTGGTGTVQGPGTPSAHGGGREMQALRAGWHWVRSSTAFLWPWADSGLQVRGWTCRTRSRSASASERVSVGAWRPRGATGWGRTPGLVANDNGLVEPCQGPQPWGLTV